MHLPKRQPLDKLLQKSETLTSTILSRAKASSHELVIKKEYFRTTNKLTFRAEVGFKLSTILFDHTKEESGVYELVAYSLISEFSRSFLELTWLGYKQTKPTLIDFDEALVDRNFTGLNGFLVECLPELGETLITKLRENTELSTGKERDFEVSVKYFLCIDPGGNLKLEIEYKTNPDEEFDSLYTVLKLIKKKPLDPT